MEYGEKVREALKTHPCYNENAHRDYARMHIPVAPRCNIQCNYCNRKFDCSNESRPGVTSEVLSPQQAVEKIGYVKDKIPELSVVGIAGPGDPMANEATFESINLIHEKYPDITLCVSTNGLMLPDNVDRLYAAGVRFVTVTVNAVDASVGSKIYDFVSYKGQRYVGKEAAQILLDRQMEGIKKCIDLGIVVKINVVMIPGINVDHIPTLVKTVKEMGVFIINILPLIPVKGTKFENLEAPTATERKNLIDLCDTDANMMRHCRQCRADAIGKLNEDRSSEFAHIGCNSECGSMTDTMKPICIDRDANKIAIATSDGENVDSGFGNAKRFDIYVKKDGGFLISKSVSINTDFSVSGKDHRTHLKSVLNELEDSGTIVVKEIGSLPEKMLETNGVGISVFDGKIKDLLKRI